MKDLFKTMAFKLLFVNELLIRTSLRFLCRICYAKFVATMNTQQVLHMILAYNNLGLHLNVLYS